MKKRKFKQFFIRVLCALFVFMALPMTIHADIGPKASVHIQFKNMPDELCYGTLLSEKESTGPASVWDGIKEHARKDEETADIWNAFVNYKDPDGYYYLQQHYKVSDTNEIAWTYYPPNRFKILLYYPETGTFVSSGIYERYAFDTYYTVDMEGIDIHNVEYNEELSTNERIEAYRSYEYRQEMIGLAVRIVLTIVIEMLVALLFGFREKKQLVILAVVNIITQILLNVGLNIINYNSGSMAFTIFYVLLEVVVFIVEAILYCTLLKKASMKKKKNWYYVLYSFIANLVSFTAGMIIANVIPGIF